MLVISDTTSQQTIKIMPRELNTSVNFYFEDKEQDTNIFDDIVSDCVIDGEFLIIPFAFSFLKEGRKYFIRVTNLSGERIWLGEAFCTNETDIQNFKVDEQ